MPDPHSPASDSPPRQFLFANSGCGEFAQQAALSLLEADRLAAYATSFAANVSWRGLFSPDSGWGPGKRWGQHWQRRTVRTIPADKVRSWPALELLRILVNRLDTRGLASDWMWEQAEKYFARRIATEVRRGESGVYGYEYASLESFQAAADRDLPRVYDVPSLEHDHLQAVIRKEVAATGELHDAYFARTEEGHAARSRRRHQEWELASFVMANSEVTKRSYEVAGRDVSKVYVVPLAAPPVVREQRQATAGPLRFMYAGTVSIRKGCHTLVQAWRTLAAGAAACLDLYGARQLPAAMLQGIDGLCWHGPVSAPKLRESYLAADVLVFPTLGDGFGLVVTEALAHGLPVISTAQAGASMLIEHRQNGLIVPAGDAAALTTAMQWCLDHRPALAEMKHAALSTAANWQWPDYRRRFAETFTRAMSTHCQ